MKFYALFLFFIFLNCDKRENDDFSFKLYSVEVYNYTNDNYMDLSKNKIVYKFYSDALISNGSILIHKNELKYQAIIKTVKSDSSNVNQYNIILKDEVILTLDKLKNIKTYYDKVIYFDTLNCYNKTTKIKIYKEKTRVLYFLNDIEVDSSDTRKMNEGIPMVKFIKPPDNYGFSK